MTRRLATRGARVATGFTLVEMMVAMAIGLAVVGALANAALASFVTGRHTDALVQITEDAAFALALMRQQVAQAGYSQPRGTTGDGLVLHRFTAISGCAAAGFNDLRAGIGVAGNCRPGDRDPDASDALEVAFEASVLPGQASNGVLGGMDGAQPLDCLGNSFPKTHDDITGDDFWLDDSKFYVADGSLHCHGPGHAAGAALVQNVETLRVRYGMAAGPPGAGRLAWHGAAPPPGSPLWAEVVSVTLCIQVRSAAKVLDARAAATLGRWIDCGDVPRTATDGYLRRSFTTTIALENRLP